MAQIRRRKTLQFSAASALAAGTGGLAGILASGRAPAYGQTQTMHWLRWADFVPASDQLLKGESPRSVKKTLGMKLTVETINANDIQARITAAIQSGAGPDIFMPSTTGRSFMPIAAPMSATWPRRSARRRAVSTTFARASAPLATSGLVCPGRRRRPRRLPQVLARRGRSPTDFPKTWDEYRTVGKKLKAAGQPYGQTAGHTFGDAPGWWYPYLWSWGGKEVEADGKTVVLNTKETVELVKFAVALWKETMDEGGLAWDDTSNNRAFLSGSISATNNGASIYLERRRSPIPI